jgi:hypothetical protein
MAEPSNQLNTPVAHDLAGTTVGRFIIRNRLGAGGMGQVYAAEDTTLKRRVAIKRMTPRLRSDPGDLKRFLKEAQRASALSILSFALPAAVVCHCIFDGSSAPPQARGLM